MNKKTTERATVKTTEKAKKHKWEFSARFRRNAFGWKSQPAIKRIKEAISEIKKVAKKDPILGAQGAVLFLEKVAPAIEHVDSSSGAIGTAVNNAIAALVPIITDASAEDVLRDKWLERLWEAIQEDRMPYIESLTDYWGQMCVTPERASKWADEFIHIVRISFGESSYFQGTSVCLSALLKAERYQDILDLLALQAHKFWHNRIWGAKALAAMGKYREAIQYAEENLAQDYNTYSISVFCEEVLLSQGLEEEAYKQYGFMANTKTTNLNTFRSIVKKYPNKAPREILFDLADNSAEPGKWFAAAKSAGLYKEAIILANRSHCDPRTLTRAARDMCEKDPSFAKEAGIAALKWIIEGYGYEITSADVLSAYRHTVNAAKNAGCKPKILENIEKLIDTGHDECMCRMLRSHIQRDRQDSA